MTSPSVGVVRKSSIRKLPNVRAKERGKETTGETSLRLPSVPFPWSLAVHHQSLASALRKTKRLRRRLELAYILVLINRPPIDRSFRDFPLGSVIGSQLYINFDACAVL